MINHFQPRLLLLMLSYKNAYSGNRQKFTHGEEIEWRSVASHIQVTTSVGSLPAYLSMPRGIKREIRQRELIESRGRPVTTEICLLYFSIGLMYLSPERRGKTKRLLYQNTK